MAEKANSGTVHQKHTIAEQKKQVATVCRNFLSIPWTPISQMQRASSQFTHDAPARGGI
jgi:hypothetical protein